MKRILILFILVGIKSFSYFEVAPPIQTIDLNRVRTSEAYVINDSDKLVRVRIYPQRPEDQKDEELYLGEWMVIYPQLLYLKPKSKRSVRFGMRIPGELEDGEYRSEIVFEELSNEEVIPESGEAAEEEGERKEAVSFGILTTIISTIYGNSGEVIYKANLKDFVVKKTNEKMVAEGLLINEGTGSIRTLVNLTYLDGKNKEIKSEEREDRKLIRENENLLTFDLEEVPKEAKFLLIKAFHLKEGEEEEEKIELSEIQLSL